MEITYLPQPYSLSLTNLTAKGSGGPISLPVRQTHYLYSQLKNIRGVPSFGGRPGYTLGKLRSLDNLIERLRSLRGESAYEFPTQRDGAAIDAMIKYHQRELKRELEVRIPGFLGNPIRDQGLTLNIFA